MTDSANTLWTTGYFGDFKVSVTVDLANMQVAIESMANIGRIIEALQAAGVTANLAGLAPGEETAPIAYVCQRKWMGKDGKEKHVVDLYAEWLQFKWFTLYLDSDDDKQAFESASGLKLANMPLITSGIAPDKNPHDKNLVAVNFEVVYTPRNPDVEGSKDKFERYANQASTDSTPAPASNGNGASSDNGSKPANTKQVTLQAALYVTHKDGVRVYYIKDIDGNKYWTTHGSLIEFASEHPGKLEPDTAHKILGLGGAIATVNADTQEVTAIEAEATADAAVDF